MKVLHIIATPRNVKSNTLQVSKVFLDALAAHHPEMQIDVVDLFDSDLPALAGANIEAKYTLLQGQPIDKDHEESWRQIETLIQHFLSADAYVISAPMWNFGIPYTLKYYIDCLVQPGYVFGFNETGVVPMVHGKRMVCVTARGSDYSLGSPLHAYDFQEPYLRSIFGFIGITDIEFISVQPTDISALREAAFETALKQAQSLADSPSWSGEALSPSALPPGAPDVALRT